MKKRISPVESLSAAVLVVVCCGARLYGIYPFGTPMFTALVASGMSGGLVALLAPIYLVMSYLLTFEIRRLYISGAAVLLAVGRWFLALKVRRCNAEPVKIAVSIAAIAVETTLVGLFGNVVSAVIGGAVSIAFCYFSRRVARFALGGFSVRPSVIDCVAMFAVGVVFALACGGAQYDAFRIGLVFVYFAALILTVAGDKPALVGGIAFGLGLGRFGLDASVAFIAATAATAAFGKLPRPVYAVIGIGVYASIGVMFSLSPVVVGFDAAMLAAGALPFCLLPRRAVKALRAYFDYSGSARLALRHYINRVKADAGNRMLSLAEIFDETARLMNGFGDPEPDFAVVGETLASGICPYCPQNVTCDKTRAASAYAELARRAYSGGSIIAEMPDFFAHDCCRAAEIVGAAGRIADGARERAVRAESETRAKTVVVERLTAIKDVLGELGLGEAQPVGFDGSAEARISEELALGGCECAEALVTADNVTAIVRTACADGEKIRRAVSACMKREYAVIELERTQAAGWSVIRLKPRAAYEAVFARAGVGKTGGVSGDSYTFKRIDDRFLTALVDGMGSGETASETSSAAVELIECFYRAGFDSKSALAGVNRFLKIPGGERFSAADVAVCDLDAATVDIIKVGAPPSYIKTADTVLRIDGSSLPIGVLDEMRPFVTVKKLYPGQMLILVTDGVSDCFDGDELPAFINGLAALNPEKTAKEILARALKLCGGAPRDDMTVIAFRLFEVKRGKRIKN